MDTGAINGVQVTVYVGQSVDPGTGLGGTPAAVVYTTGADGVPTDIGTFAAPAGSGPGPLTATGETGDQLAVSASDGKSLTFNVVTHQFQ